MCWESLKRRLRLRSWQGNRHCSSWGRRQSWRSCCRCRWSWRLSIRKERIWSRFVGFLRDSWRSERRWADRSLELRAGRWCRYSTHLRESWRRHSWDQHRRSWGQRRTVWFHTCGPLWLTVGEGWLEMRTVLGWEMFQRYQQINWRVVLDRGLYCRSLSHDREGYRQ